MGYFMKLSNFNKMTLKHTSRIYCNQGKERYAIFIKKNCLGKFV